MVLLTDFTGPSFFSPLLGIVEQLLLYFLQTLKQDLTTPKEEIQEILDKLDMREDPLIIRSQRNCQKLGIIVKDTGFFREEFSDELKNCFDLNAISELMRLTGKQRMR